MAVATQTNTPAYLESVRRRFTAGEYHAMAAAHVLGESDRVELIEGDIINMSPIGIRHAEIVRRLINRLSRQLNDTVALDAQNPVQLDEYSEPQPDITLIRATAYTDTHPTASDVYLLIEVSDTTLAVDQGTKLSLYARAGIPRYLIVDVQGNTVLLYSEPRGDGFRQTTRFVPGDTIALDILPDLVIEFEVSDIMS